MTLIQDLYGIDHDITGWTLVLRILLDTIDSIFATIGFFVVGAWIALHTIGRRHRKPAPTEPPADIDGQLREDHPDRKPNASVTVFKPGIAYMAPIGTPVDEAIAWNPLGHAKVGYLHDDGLPLTHDCVFAAPSTIHREYTFTTPIKSNRRILQLVFGKYRLHGDRPLIHKGRKP